MSTSYPIGTKTVGGAQLPGNGQRGIALVEGKDSAGKPILAFVGGKTEQACLDAFFARRNPSGRVLAFCDRPDFRPNYFKVESGVVDGAELVKAGYKIICYPASAALTLIPPVKPIPEFHPVVLPRLKNFLSQSLSDLYRDYIFDGDPSESPVQLSREMVQDVFASVLKLPMNDIIASGIAVTQQAGGSAPNMDVDEIIMGLAQTGDNWMQMCSNARQIDAFRRKDELLPPPAAPEISPSDTPPIEPAPDRPKIR